MKSNLLIASFTLIFIACKKNPSEPIIAPQNPIGEVNIKIGDSTSGSILASGIYKDQNNNLIISGIKWLYDSTVGYNNFYPMRININSNLQVSSSKAPLIPDYGTAIQSVKSTESIYTAINIEDPYTTTFTGIKVIKTDTSNNLIWSKVFKNITQATSLTLLSNGDLLLQGNYGTDLTSTKNVMSFLRLNSNGNTVFYKEFAGQYYTGSFDVIEEPNNFTLVTYHVVHDVNYETVVPALTKIDFSGNTISSTPLDSFMGGSAQFYTSFHLRKNRIGGYVLTATYSNIVDPSIGGVVNAYFYLRILNSDGSFVNSANLWLSGTPVFRIADALQTTNGNIYVLLCLDTGSDWSTQIVKYDALGNYLDSKSVSLGRFPAGLAETENNNFVIIQNNNSNNSVTLQKMDSGMNGL